MRAVTPAALDAINYAFDLSFQRGLVGAQTFYEQVVTKMPSLGRETRYAWIDRLPRMREWVGERVIQAISAREFTVVNKNYEETVRVDRNQIEDDQVGLFAPTVEMLGYAAKILPDQLVTDMITTGDSTVCYDGQFFFDVDHPTDMDNPASATQSNLLANTPLTEDNYAKARAVMRAFKGKDGTPLNILPSILMVHTNQEGIARKILTSDFMPMTVTNGSVSGAASGGNVWKGSASLIVNPFLSTDGEWYLLDGTKPIKPFVYQTRRPAQLVPLTDPSSPEVFKNRQFVWGVDSREAAGLGLWFLAMKCKPGA
jgi:phage major head subunit gpT-like protein